jgi:hypothetical protein
MASAGIPWGVIRFIRNTWLETSRGFFFVATDRGLLRTALDRSPRFCRDTLQWLDEQSHPRAQCWRELATRESGLHFCVRVGPEGEESAEEANNVHIDWHHPVRNRAESGPFRGQCSYDPMKVAAHVADLKDLRRPSPYERMDTEIAQTKAHVASLRARLPRQASFWGPLVERVTVLERELRDKCRACSGARGEREVAAMLDELARIRLAG